MKTPNIDKLRGWLRWADAIFRNRLVELDDVRIPENLSGLGEERLNAALVEMRSMRPTILDKFEQYEHHGELVWVRANMKGMHRAFCLCFSCEKFHPGDPNDSNNCPIAKQVYATCVDRGIVSPVWECPEFDRSPKRLEDD